MAANSAVEMIFGNYNKELYEEYGLFAYGGYDGIGISDFESELAEMINKNLAYKPDKGFKSYSDLYRLKDISCELANFYMLDEDEVLLKQISDYIATSTVNNIKESFIKKPKNSKNSSSKELLSEAEKYENGEYDTKSEDGESSAGDDNKNTDEDLKKDAAGGNPMKVLKNLLGNGLLSLVCDVSKVSESKTGAGEYENGTKSSSDDSSSAATFLKSLTEGEESKELEQSKLLEEAEKKGSADKLKYIYYADNVFSSYIDDKYNTVHYGMEYLIGGQETDKQNLAYVVRRLLIIRTLINMVYVSTNSVFQSKSLATATIIVGFTGLPLVIAGVQWLILTILAFEEACIDVAALLDGKEVPMIKSPTTFKMKYEEICAISYSFFKSKGQSYKKAGKSIISTDISYKQYLMLLELCVSKEKIKNRIIDIIQYDLRERFNQTFVFSDCICAAECMVSYNIPYSYSYIKKNLFGKKKTQDADRRVITSYSYVDGIWE